MALPSLNQEKEPKSPSKPLSMSTVLSSEISQGRDYSNISTITGADSIIQTEQERAYAELFGVQQIGEQFNELLAQYAQQAQMQYEQAQVQSDVAFAEARAQQGEFGAPLGTGAQAVAGSKISQTQEIAGRQLEQTMAQTNQEFVASLDESYLATIQNYFGGIDKTTGKLNAWLQYQQTADIMQSVSLEILATEFLKLEVGLGTAFDVAAEDSYMEALVNVGIIEEDENGEYFITNDGLKYLDAMFNNEKTGESNRNKMVEQAAIREVGLQEWALLTEADRQKLIGKYESWLDSNTRVFKQFTLGIDDIFSWEDGTLDELRSTETVSTVEKRENEARVLAKQYGYTFTAPGYNPQNYKGSLLELGRVLDFKVEPDTQIDSKGRIEKNKTQDVYFQSLLTELNVMGDEAIGKIVYLDHATKTGGNTKTRGLYMYTGDSRFVLVGYGTDNRKADFIPSTVKYNAFGKIILK